MKNYKFLELLRKTDFPDFMIFTCPNSASQDLSKVIDLLFSSKKLRLKVTSTPWMDSKTISAIRRRHRLFKKYKKSGLEADKDHFRSAKMTL